MLTITISNQIYLPAASVDAEMEKFFVGELSFFNPKIIELQRLGYSTWKVPKKIICYKKLKTGFYLPLGFGPRLLQYLEERDLPYHLEDKRIELPITPISSQITLKPEQNHALERILKNNRCILEARPGFGKTMLGLQTLAARAQKTLIIVHTRALLGQWQKRLTDFLDLEPGELGIIGEGKWRVGPRVTIASYQTLLSRGTTAIKNDFGLIIVDECHHVPANTFAKVVRGFSAKYCLGLTATPFRKDKLDKLMTFYLGKIIPTVYPETSQENSLLTQAAVPTTLIQRPTDLFIPDAEEKEFTELGTILSEDFARNNLIVADVLADIALGKKIIILSERVGHCQAIFSLLAKKSPHTSAVLITGQIKKAERETLFEEIKDDKYQIVVATGGVVGEGFDYPALESLFLTFPFSWRGKLIQYVGRVQRQVPGKNSASVYDYIDQNISIFTAMYRKRQRTYRELGVKL